MPIRSVCVYCGSSPGTKPVFRETAAAFGELLANRGIELIYGAGNVGLMGALADGALKAGGRVHGVIPQKLVELEVAHTGITEMHVVATMHERKAKMADLADAFVALPGGIGTFEEIFEVITMTQLGFHDKPCAFLNTNAFYTPLLDFLKHAVGYQFIRREHIDQIIVEDFADPLLERLSNYTHCVVPKRLNRP